LWLAGIRLRKIVAFRTIIAFVGLGHPLWSYFAAIAHLVKIKSAI
jgi:hypothetical protein